MIREAKIEDIKQIQIVRNSVTENTLSNPELVNRSGLRRVYHSKRQRLGLRTYKIKQTSTSFFSTRKKHTKSVYLIKPLWYFFSPATQIRSARSPNLPTPRAPAHGCPNDTYVCGARPRVPFRARRDSIGRL